MTASPRWIIRDGAGHWLELELDEVVAGDAATIRILSEAFELEPRTTLADVDGWWQPWLNGVIDVAA
jgi:hypothetical protein